MKEHSFLAKSSTGFGQALQRAQGYQFIPDGNEEEPGPSSSGTPLMCRRVLHCRELLANRSS